MAIKKYILLVMMFVTTSVNSSDAQVKNSIYSTFGIGELMDNNFGINRSLGGTGIALKSSRSINFMNPASFLGLPEDSFILELGLYGLRSTSESRHDYQTDNDINLAYGSVGAYLSESWGLSLGILPYSLVNYEVTSEDAIAGEPTLLERTFRGSGRLSRMYVGSSFKLLPELALGLTISYVVGSLKESESVPTTQAFAGYEFTSFRTFSSFNADFGLQYAFGYEDWTFAFGMTYGPSRRLVSTDSLVLVNETTLYSLQQDNPAHITIPQSVGIGISTKRGNVTVGLDYEWKNWSAANFSNSGYDLANSARYSIGIDYSPDGKDKSSMNFSYRVGANYKKSYLRIDKVPISSASVDIGVGIPFDVINLNAAIEYGEHGTINNGLTKSRYWLFSLSMSLTEYWSSIRFED